MNWAAYDHPHRYRSTGREDQTLRELPDVPIGHDTQGELDQLDPENLPLLADLDDDRLKHDRLCTRRPRQ